jgi:hypothetical protein
MYIFVDFCSVTTGEEVQYLDKSVSCVWNAYFTQLYSLLQDDSEVAPKISGCSTPRLLATGPLDEISSISLIAEGMVVKNSDTIRAILPT